MDYYTHAVAVARRVDARRWLGTWLGNLAVIAIDRREWDVAEKYNDEACRLMDETDDTPDQARCSVSAAQIAAGRGDFKTAHSLFESALHKYVEDPSGFAGCPCRIGWPLLPTEWIRQGRRSFATL